MGSPFALSIVVNTVNRPPSAPTFSVADQIQDDRRAQTRDDWRSVGTDAAAARISPAQRIAAMQFDAAAM
jgi:hypothetical protein